MKQQSRAKNGAPAPAGEKKKATIRDIAALCNVSPMAVSMVTNNKGGVSKKTAEKIWKAVRKLNYTPNMVAKSLRVSATKTIGVIISDSSHLLFTKLLKGIGDAAEESGYSIIMASTDQNPERERHVIDVLVNKRIDGLILAAPILTDDGKILDVINFGIPLVMIMRRSAFDIDSVCTDNFNGAYAMVDYLCRTGSGTVHMINLPRDSQSGSERLRGYRQALLDNGRKCDLRSVQHINPQIADGRDAMIRLLDRGLTGGAVFCGCDLIAIGVIEAARSRGLRVPEDIRICGFDDIEMLDHLAVPLTTIRQPIDQMARLSLALLLDRIANPQKPTNRLILPNELIVRKST